jgi:predicted phosphodiesterase
MAIKFLTFSDLHAPVQDPAAVRWMLDTIEREKPDLIVANGDMLDGDAWSRWENEHDWTILDEYREWAKIAKTINELAPSALKVWLYGNHEANLWEPGRVPKKLRGIVHWKDYRPEGVPCLAEEMQGWRLVQEYGSHIRWSCGPIVFTHGTKAGINAARDEARMHGHAFSLTISGHTHRPIPVTRSVNAGNIPEDIWFANSGMLSDPLKMRYIHRSNFQAWGQALVVGEIYSESKTMLKEGKRAFAKKIWDAETRVRSICRDTMG